MNYNKIYESLMKKALNRKEPDCYYEKHHILPRAYGGSNHESNIVKLTAREHFIAHRLLSKIYKCSKMRLAVYLMCQGNSSSARGVRVTSRTFERVKLEFIEAKRITAGHTENRIPLLTTVKTPRGLQNSTMYMHKQYRKTLATSMRRIIVNLLACKDFECLTYSRNLGNAKKLKPREISRYTTLKAIDMLESFGYLVNNISALSTKKTSTISGTEKLYQDFGRYYEEAYRNYLEVAPPEIVERLHNRYCYHEGKNEHRLG